MDLKGSLVNTQLRIYPAQHFTTFLKALPDDEDIPANILKLTGRDCKGLNEDIARPSFSQLNNEDIEHIKVITEFITKTSVSDTNVEEPGVSAGNEKSGDEKIDSEKVDDESETRKEKSGDTPEKQANKNLTEKDIDETKEADGKTALENNSEPFLATSDIDWLYSYLQKRKAEGNDVPYLHALLEGANVEMPDNKVIKRNPQLEARCVKLRAQQEAREYRKMTKTVDNVRLRFPEDSISYQMKQLNRQLIAIGQFVISIFAGFLFGFRGVEWMVGNLDFGFRLLLGVMCALVIALAEIYFLAKKLNEELNIPETVQLGGPPKFVDEKKYMHLPSKPVSKEHQD